MLRSQKGMTLIEVMAAVVILGILVVSFTNISNYLFASERKYDRSVEALNLAEGITNEVRSALMAGSTPAKYNVSINPLTGTETYNSRTYTYKITRSAYSTDSSTALNLASPVPGNTQRSLQSMYLVKNQSGVLVPEWLTVTVSWEGS
ncbi:type IV pilus modification PilV family protein [Gorillibacterium sp. sgz5001074]|uniref:type IV pilus modification PilV family protein n=1 Tax=Gorillibacterium sp. sgz5001074 TaxID=3446695 RepID=UPI003F6708EE